MTCAHVSVEPAGPAYPRGTLACRTCGAIVPPETIHGEEVCPETAGGSR